ncbi:putative membrane protein [Escherichia coli 3-267-03_S3_C2]|nr:putative membrane protein [Escherichia coli 3-267-03_S3_C2]
MSRRAWFLSFVLWIVFCIRCRSALGIGTMIGITQSGW